MRSYVLFFSAVLSALVIFWNIMYFGIFLPFYLSVSLGNMIPIWEIQRRFVDISRDGTDAYWYYRPLKKIPVRSCRHIAVPSHAYINQYSEIDMCILKTKVELQSKCFYRITQILKTMDGDFGALIYKSEKRFDLRKSGCS